MSSPILTLPQIPKNIDRELFDYLTNLTKILQMKQSEDFGQSQESEFKVNSTYIQFPHVDPDGTYIGFREEDEPASLFGGVWYKIFDDEGVFFKTEGYEPDQIYNSGILEDYRINGISKDKMQKITGTLDARSRSGSGKYPTSFATGSFSVGITLPGGTSTLTGTVADSRRIEFNSSDSPDARTSATTAGRTEPQNRLIKVWKREA